MDSVETITGPVTAVQPAKQQRRWFLLAILLIVTALSQVDRNIINILAEPIKHELGLVDKQLGLLTGLSFALFYAVLGLPIARFADRNSRPLVIGLSILVWSLFTMLSGFATSFLWLMVARIGVGCGEGGSGPASHSLVADITTPQNRASALAIIAIGSPLGTLLGFLFGGLIADAWGWRMAFVVAAIPGILVGAILLAMVRDPRHHDPVRRAAHLGSVVTLGSTLAALRRKRAFWWVCAAGAATAFMLYGLGVFYASFYLRNHGDALAQFGSTKGSVGVVGVILGLLNGCSGMLGVYLGGRATDWVTKRDMRGYCLVPAIALAGSVPCFVVALLAPNLALSLAGLFAGLLLQGSCLSPAYATVQTLAKPAMRATAAAIFLFIITIVGLGFGPLATGTLSDWLSHGAGTGESLRLAMLAITPIGFVAAACYWMASRSVLDELELS